MCCHKQPKVFWVNLNITMYQKFTPPKKGGGYDFPFSFVNKGQPSCAHKTNGPAPLVECERDGRSYDRDGKGSSSLSL